MRKFASLMLLLAAFAVPAVCETFNNVPVVDKNCSSKVAANPDAHTRECALKCAASGYGIVTQDHKFLKFDSEGNAKIKQALEASNKKDHLRVDVTGDVENDTLKVKSINLL
ncbi:MAG TPA: hypothetical protein VJP02_24095 [Candidatus Sulfotelmatobacter sp.]|nr:hypothetical protein [Candidatus Sulfotelmatobacter sp.]